MRCGAEVASITDDQYSPVLLCSVRNIPRDKSYCSIYTREFHFLIRLDQIMVILLDKSVTENIFTE